MIFRQALGFVMVCGLVAGPIVTAARTLNDRMAAFHETLVCTDEMRPNSCVSTYMNDKFSYMDAYSLTKLVTGLRVGGDTLWPASSTDIRVDDIPGGVVARYKLGRVKVTTEIVPLLIGRETKEQDGAALYTVKTEPPTPIVVVCGEGRATGYSSLSRNAWLRSDDVGAEGDAVEMSGNVAMLKSTNHPFAVAVCSSVKIDLQKGDKGGSRASIRFDEGSGSILIAYGKAPERVVELAKTDPKAARQAVSAYYTKLLQCRIETPEKNLNAAFRSALYNLEYNWIKPYGWNECIHHWYALWHMQHTGAAEWIGQADRSRDCNVTTAEHLMPNGAAPQFFPSGTTHRDFGGSNQFFAWQVRHYWNFTADRKMIEQVAPQLDAVIQETFDESDRDHDGLLAWGQQIGNQEDYVSTPFNGTSPTVEGINMLKTGAMFARALGKSEEANDYERRATEATVRLRSELWQSELGRYAFYKDPLGQMRIDGQYHTEIYPVIWGILDPLDSWTSMRHVRDRLIGPGGECFCSNNFPNHIACTCGPQGGAAQQPWAAWGLAAVGLRNETYRPLKAVAEWVMNEDHRGSWPEMEREPTPAYFSPPAGLFVQSTVEALFGLTVNRPEGYLKISPSFPDKWPSAKLNLPEYSASYACKGNALEYAVASRTPLARRLRWMLPPLSFKSVKVNGKQVKFKTLPGVEYVTLCVDVPAQTRTRFEIAYKPVDRSYECSRLAAEGEEYSVFMPEFHIEKIEDRSRVFSSLSAISGGELHGTIRVGQLKPYAGFGRLGQMNFSRRTFFVLGKAQGVRFWVPVDLTILPRYECSAKEIDPDGTIKLLVRNNTTSHLTGQAYLSAVQKRFSFKVDLQARSEKTYTIRIPQDLLALVSPGDNRASLLLPGKNELNVTLLASRLFDSNAKLRDYAASRIASVPIPEAYMRTDAEWRQVRDLYAYGHYPWAGSKPPLEALAGKSEVTVPGLPCVNFKIIDRKMAVVSWRSGEPSISVNLDSQDCKKIYVLLVPLLDNHDTFASVARVDVTLADAPAISRTLNFPGDLDWWCPQEIVGDFATARTPRADRFGLLPMLLPMLGEGAGDWPEGKPPAFPQPDYWATLLALKTPSAVMNVVEIDLGRPSKVKSVRISTLGVDPALGVAAISVEKTGGQDLLQGTQWMPPPEYLEPKTVFEFTQPGDLKGWKTEGDAFSVAPVPSLFIVPTLNSLARAGETATGKAISPDFTVGPSDSYLTFTYHGGTSTLEDGPGLLAMDLIDSTTGQRLERLLVNGSHILRDGQMSVEKWRGRKVHLELTDQNPNTGWAWLGIQRVGLKAK